jgi:hypothetical protein
LVFYVGLNGERTGLQQLDALPNLAGFIEVRDVASEYFVVFLFGSYRLGLAYYCVSWAFGKSESKYRGPQIGVEIGGVEVPGVAHAGIHD